MPRPAVADAAELESVHREGVRVEPLLGGTAGRTAGLAGHAVRPLVVGVARARGPAVQAGDGAGDTVSALPEEAAAMLATCQSPSTCFTKPDFSSNAGQHQHQAGVEDVPAVDVGEPAVEPRVVEVELGHVARDAARAVVERVVRDRARPGVRRLELRSAAEAADDLRLQAVVDRVAAVVPVVDAAVAEGADTAAPTASAGVAARVLEPVRRRRCRRCRPSAPG